EAKLRVRVSASAARAIWRAIPSLIRTSGECRTIGLHQHCDFAEPAGVDDEPGIANPRRALHRHVGLPGNIERRSTRAHRFYADPGVADCVEPALILIGP